MMRIYFLHSVVHSLSADPILWCLIVFLFSFLLGVMAFLIINHRIVKCTENVLAEGLVGIWTSAIASIITAVAILVHIILFTRFPMPHAESFVQIMMNLLLVALFAILTTIHLILALIVIRKKGKTDACAGLICENRKHDPPQSDRQEQSIYERQSYPVPSKAVADYVLCVSMVVLIFGLISEAWYSFSLGTGTSKPITHRSSGPVRPNTLIPPETNEPMTLGCSMPIALNVNTSPRAVIYTYQTENAWGDITEWHTASNLSFAIDGGNGAVPAMLAWTDQQGNAASISFQTDMSTFFGYFQRPNEGPIAYRGTLLRQRVETLGAARRYTYQTAHAWGDITKWRCASNLSFAINIGNGAAPATLKWKDQQGNAASISFQTDMSTFFGYYQRSDERPIAYRGRLLR